MLADWLREDGRKAIEEMGDVYMDLRGVDFLNQASGDRVVLAMYRDRARKWLAGYYNRRGVKLEVVFIDLSGSTRVHKSYAGNPDLAWIAAVLATKEGGR